MEPSKKRMSLEKKKQARETANNLELQKKRAKQYKTIMDSAKKQDLLSKKAEKYKTMDSGKKEELLQKQKQKYYSNKSKNVDSCIETFKK